MKERTPVADNELLSGFPPVIDSAVEILILGSFPGVASLVKAQYYGHPQNQFWRLTGAAIGVPLWELDYEARLQALLSNRIGLWDIITACKRAGSLDAAIRAPQHNDFSRVTRVAAHLRRVCFNGRMAATMESSFTALGYETLLLPSSSAAHTMRFEEKLGQWRHLAAARPKQGYIRRHGNAALRAC